ncbi:class I SAM-dependent methyltransferase [Mycobacterium branderi]|uniref:S-adenosyl-L-methionine-dependent methyltransferase n=1 Tax=Mycobacterium branderi TaxID=43348 RepID=A0A7I7W1V1_9MYCO|nr:class I SAM-dependent methyltransferase [Mycobacterium branderi]MCV7234814.1 class I SAM-dependent methyltransferase [Mycobacterium branderi]ORA33594.1 SAM-dependent methyltransferase [Mycobacterium branderi]BBZ11559.1 putative S-adenosyl-L-methionine-dependent methyltransferase [Mycobacterium branderi]
MPRTDDDSWDITESVGSTALGVAAARAAETAAEQPLIRDPFAQLFVDAAGRGMWSLFTDPALRAQLVERDPALRSRMQVMVDFMAVRTAFFDEFFLDAARSGVRQIVILAAGLDARAWRLPWPDATTVYELDQASVLEFKSATLQQHDARPTSTLVNVPVDLRQDWPTALQQAGFDPRRPTAWSAEGLVRYLPAWAQDLLFERIDAQSAAGSWLAVNAPAPNFLDPDLLARQHEQAQRFQAAAAELLDTELPNADDLWYREERTDVTEWLREHGWQASATGMAAMLARYGRYVPAEDVMPPTVFISAQRPD